MSYQSVKFRGKGIRNKNLWKSLKKEISFKIQMIFLSFVNLNVVQESKQVKLYL